MAQSLAILSRQQSNEHNEPDINFSTVRQQRSEQKEQATRDNAKKHQLQEINELTQMQAELDGIINEGANSVEMRKKLSLDSASNVDAGRPSPLSVHSTSQQAESKLDMHPEALRGTINDDKIDEDDEEEIDEVEHELRNHEEVLQIHHLDGPTQAATPQLPPVAEQTEDDLSLDNSRALSQIHQVAGYTDVTGVMQIPEQPEDDDEEKMIAQELLLADQQKDAEDAAAVM